jgi:prepilin-type N-terminal cleavage/methylation domain-containing protein
MDARIRSGRSGFTFSEVLIAVMLFGLVTAFVTPGLIWMMRFARGGSQQVEFTQMARRSQLFIARAVSSGKYVSASTNEVQIFVAGSNVIQRVFFADLDNNPSTISNNVLQFDPDASVDDDEYTICNYVCRLPGEALFTNAAASPKSVNFRYHVGEGSNAYYSSVFSSSPGFQGVEVRFSATPRNVQTFYQ